VSAGRASRNVLAAIAVRQTDNEASETRVDCEPEGSGSARVISAAVRCTDLGHSTRPQRHESEWRFRSNALNFQDSVHLRKRSGTLILGSLRRRQGASDDEGRSGAGYDLRGGTTASSVVKARSRKRQPGVMATPTRGVGRSGSRLRARW